jgi:hypothetical protein
MAERFVPERAFPEEIVADLRAGVPEPVLYSGPLYTGNGDHPALRRLRERRKKPVAPQSDAELLAQARDFLRAGDWSDASP